MYFYIFLLLLCIKNIRSHRDVEDRDYYLMPDLFHMDDFDKCMSLEDEALYCSITYEVQPLDPDNKSQVWNVIQKIIQNPKNYRHDWLRHSICLPITCPEIPKTNYFVGNNNGTLMEGMKNCYDRIFKEQGLKGEITKMHCEDNKSNYKINLYDIFVAVIIAVLIFLVMFASIYEGTARYKPKEEYNRIIGTPVGKFLTCFSIVNNYERLSRISKNADSVRMRSIQGIRFYNMLAVILAHTVMTTYYVPVYNPAFYEQAIEKKANMFVANGGYVVQTFFAISGWLTAFHFFEMFEGKKDVPITYLIYGFINRYIRLTPALLLVISFNSTWFVHLARGPIWDRIVGDEYRRCRQNGWTNLLYVNNYVNKEEMCLQQTWYLAADTQVFIFALLVVWSMRKYNNHVGKILTTAITIATLFPMAINFFYNFDVLTRHYPEPLYDVLLKVQQWHIMFSSGLTNMAGYMVGITFGYLYYNCREKKVIQGKLQTAIAWFLTWTVPISVVMAAGFMYKDDFKISRFGAAFYVGIARTLYPFGIMLGIFCITQQQGWLVKYVTEWKPVQVLGKLTYSAYLIHSSVIRLRIGLMRTPVYINEYLLSCSFFGDVVWSYIIATVLCLCLEMPISALQKIAMNVGDKEEKKVKVVEKSEKNDKNEADTKKM